MLLGNRGRNFKTGVILQNFVRVSMSHSVQEERVDLRTPVRSQTGNCSLTILVSEDSNTEQKKKIVLISQLSLDPLKKP